MNNQQREQTSADKASSDVSSPMIGGMTCEQFQDQLPELLAAGGTAFADDHHLLGCANCAALVRDLQYIAEAARQLLPVHDPSPDLWNQIQSSLEREPVIPDGNNHNGHI